MSSPKKEHRKPTESEKFTTSKREKLIMNAEAGTRVMKMIQIKVKDLKKTSVSQTKNDPKRFYYR